MEKRDIFRTKHFLICVFVFLTGIIVGYLRPGFFDENHIQVVNLIRLTRDSVLSLNGLGTKIVVLFFYYSFFLLFLYIFSLILGLGAFLFIFTRGVLLGIIFFVTRDTPLSLFLISPFGLLESLLLITAGSIGLNLGQEALNLLRGRALDKKNFILSAQILALMTPLFIASYFVDDLIVTLIFSL